MEILDFKIFARPPSPGKFWAPPLGKSPSYKHLFHVNTISRNCTSDLILAAKRAAAEENLKNYHVGDADIRGWARFH